MSLLGKPIYVFADGASRGNPGPGAMGWVITYKNDLSLKDFLGDEGSVISYGKKYLGYTTNNQAEYLALIAAIETLKEAKEKNYPHVTVFMDSELIINQMRGVYRVKNPELRVLHEKAKIICQNLHISFQHIPRKKNSVADYLANLALKEYEK